MNTVESVLPKVLAIVLLVVCLLMFGTVVYLAITMLGGGKVAAQAWMFPLTILSIGTILMWLLTRRQLSFRLYMAALTLWLLTTGYYFTHFRAMMP